tara:strand:- start:651 stop:1121 length:471 start_codon:yes stop_codon:yes gene_type:complete
MFLVITFYINIINMVLHPEVWGPKYWFVLITISLNYPLYPNEVVKKKYYDLIQNIPLLIPVKDISNSFTKLLDDFPVTPYLDSRESFIKWVHFIHNKMNILNNKPELTLDEALEKYYENYKNQDEKLEAKRITREKIAYTLLLISLISITVYTYKK